MVHILFGALMAVNRKFIYIQKFMTTRTTTLLLRYEESRRCSFSFLMVMSLKMGGGNFDGLFPICPTPSLLSLSLGAAHNMMEPEKGLFPLRRPARASAIVAQRTQFSAPLIKMLRICMAAIMDVSKGSG